jgi:homoserine acetyltransferase
MRGTQEGRDFKDDIPLAFEGLPFNQLASMVNWWLRETAPSGTSVKQIKIITSLFPNPTVFVADNNAIATGGLFATGVTRVDSVNGHSLGGYLATAFTRLFGNSLSVEHTTTFNSAGFRTAANSDIETAFVQIQSLIGAQKGRSSFNNDTQQDNFYAENGLNLTTHAAMGVTGFTQCGKRTALYQEFSSSQVPNHYMYKQTDLLALGAALIVSRSFRGSIRCLVI